MFIKVLGAAAGGGYPQWNCNHPNSRLARTNNKNALARTQSSIAVSADGKKWFVFNASPDLRQQIWNNPELMPSEKDPLRYSPIMGVVLTNADVDHTAGLINLRESQKFSLYGTNRVLDVIGKNSIFNVLNPKFVNRIPIELDNTFKLIDTDNNFSGISIKPFAVPGKVALWLEDESKGKNFGSVEEDTIALEVSNIENKKFFYIPACASIPDWLLEKLNNSELVFFDGTLWEDDEMIKENVGIKTGKRMGHISMSGDEGSIEIFKKIKVKRKIFIHINTTNPSLLENSSERKTTKENGWEIAYDSMEINL
ncbi:MAG: Coenzyme PQQ synthesis protein B [Alphaproteobacteria bacterium MarineAlpha9_Bin4]|nr:pyrroloquinoline quinone biosynthesis protein PqqB [Pelagibacterales bacterium]PPR27471.1 MAG: Coenzyme PQQ synthesis protein B [Alphaproteobacteria bacterium MarineAlpha9_Bin4]|tara:strand:- start:1827 stop:2759 length:933 start_codon:yes stop_codon:yes gene_type:complete